MRIMPCPQPQSTRRFVSQGPSRGTTCSPARRSPAHSRWCKHTRRPQPAHVQCQLEPASGAEVVSPPKFLPFNSQGALRDHVLSFQYTVPCEEGLLVVKPVRQECVKEAAEILTDSFAESMGYLSTYKNFLRRQISQYLMQHINMPPKSVVLVALLQRPGAATADELQGTQVASLGSSPGASTGSSEEELGIGSSSTTIPGSSAGSSISLQASPGHNGSARAASPPPFQPPPSPAAAGRGGSFTPVGMNTWQSWRDELDGPAAPQEGLPGGVAAFPPPFSMNGAKLDSAEVPYDGGVEGSATGSPSSGGGGGLPGGSVVGVCEVSFSPSTRSQFLTLNPPKDQPYLCNMAVAAEQRGKGYGSHIMGAADELVALVGQSEVYLHVRFQDEQAARLYRKLGFQAVDQDNMLLSLVGMDRRYLMCKKLREP